ncbi:response regulator [Pseudanabaena sp. Chao 1811]|uniref:response regulator n=1 Tax=Pseudanabaena sp. Chao 1811 TaxID=2963092 RepID=UPI0022F3999B|nr:response regulator [Pseudanabaena sp. Chao 1811]
MPPIKVLVVEDEVITGRVISEELTLIGYAVTDLATSDEETFASISENKPDIVLMDILLKGSSRDGIEIATILRQEYHLPVIYITAHTDDTTLERARRSEPYGYLVKPFDERDLRVAIETASYKHSMERQLALREAQLSAILKSTHDAVIATDRVAEVIYMNTAAENLTGWHFDEALGKEVTEIFRLVDEYSGEEIANPVPQVLRSGQVTYLNDSTTMIDRYGTQKPVCDSASPIYLPSGEIDGAVMVLWDMSDRKRTEAALRESELRFRNAFENAAIGMALNMIDGKFFKVNQALCEILGYSESELLSLTHQEITHEEDKQADLDATNSLLAGEISSFKLEKRFLHKDGYIVWILLSVSLVRDISQHPMYLIAQMQNISDRKQAEISLYQLNKELEDRVSQRTEALKQTEVNLIAANAQLERTNAELARATRLKDEFLASMSHEFRTPLNAILGMAEGMQTKVFGEVNELQIRALQTIESSGAHLLELINDILDIAKIESGRIELEYAPISVETLCKASLIFIKQQALKKNIQIETKLQPNLPSLIADERRIRQVLINLLNNAVKFTPESGRITIEVKILPPELVTTTSAQQHFLRISVIDTGIGIALENMQKLFHPFIQIDSALNRQYQGTGLGLALVKRIVELHSGRVGLTSELGVGSCFSIDLPCTPTVPLPSTSAENTNIKSRSPDQVINTSRLIFLIDDNEAYINTISNYLEAKNYRIFLAKNTQETIALAKIYQPDLLLMDIQMPVTNGLEVLKQIRRELNLVNVPVIVLTGLGMAGDREQYLEAGATAFLTQPIKLNQLSATIQQLLQ